MTWEAECIAEGCGKPTHAGGWCKAHYQKAWRLANALTEGKRMSTREYLYGISTEEGNEFISTLEVLSEMDTEKLALAFELGSVAYGALVGLDAEDRSYRNGPMYPHEEFIPTMDDGLGSWWDWDESEDDDGQA